MSPYFIAFLVIFLRKINKKQKFKQSFINKNEVFKPYKDLCAKIAETISEYNPTYNYPRSLSTTLIETAHHQQYFSENLPKLTDVSANNKGDFTSQFLEDLLFKTLG